MRIEHPDLENFILKILGLTKHQLEWYWNSWYENEMLVIEVSNVHMNRVLSKIAAHPYFSNAYHTEDGICIEFVIPPEHQPFFDSLKNDVDHIDRLRAQLHEANEKLQHTISMNLARCDKEG